MAYVNTIWYEDDIITEELARKSEDELKRISDGLTTKVDIITGKGLSTNDYDDIEKAEVAKVSDKADVSYVDIQIAAVASGSPAGVYATLGDLESAYPTGDTSIYIVAGNANEIDALSVTGAPTVSANVTVTLNGVNKFVAVLSTDSTSDMATKLRAATYPGWVTGGSGTDVTFTNLLAGVVIPPIFSAGGTGSTATFSVSTLGTSYGDWYYWSGAAWTYGGVYLASWVADGSITDAKISSDTHLLSKIIGKNKFNKDTITAGYYVNYITGNLTASASYDASDYIPVLPLTDYVTTTNKQQAYYDADYVFISGLALASPEAVRTFTTPANCRFVRASINAGSTTFQFELGTTATAYESYNYTIDSTYLLEGSLDSKIVAVPAASLTGEITALQTEFTEQGKNLFNKATITAGYYVSNVNGVLAANAAYDASDWIPVLAETEYSISVMASTVRIAYYDSDKVFISGATSFTSPVTTPALTAFVRFSFVVAALNTQQFELGTTVTFYQSYRRNLVGVYPPTDMSLTDIGIDVILNLPSIIPAVVGHEVNIYFANIVSMSNADNYQFDVACTKGQQQIERWTYVPEAGDVGDISIIVYVYRNFILIDSVVSAIRVSAVVKGDGQTLKTLTVGDSTTQNNVMINELANLFSTDGMGITFIGTQGTTPNFHEGYSGKDTNWIYTNVSSPFVYAGAFNFATYLSTYSLATPDVVILNLGINDMFTYTDDISTLAAIATMITQYNSMVTNIKVSNVNMKFGVCVTIPSGNQDAFGSSYDSDQTSWRYNRNNRLLTDALINYFKDKEADKIYLVPINVNLDTVNNIQLASAVNINSRNPLQIVRQLGGVHPGTYGYYQIADMIYNWLKSMAT